MDPPLEAGPVRADSARAGESPAALGGRAAVGALPKAGSVAADLVRVAA